MIRSSTALGCGILAVGLTAVLPAQQPLPFSVIMAIGRALPERSNAGAAFLSPGAVTNLLIEKPCEVRLVFAAENATQRNSVGWFTWREQTGGIEILDSRMLFPDVERTTLTPSTSLWLSDDGVTPRTFQAGERVGFFMIADGFQTAHPLVTNWPGGNALPSTDPVVNRGVGRGLYTTLPAINPEALVDDGSRAGHAALVRMHGVPHYQSGAELLVLGFEDLLRTANSDHDFNDAVFVVDVQPHDAIDRAAITLYDPVDADGDGVDGIEDAFPYDPERAWVRRSPAHGYTVLAFEDFYPAIGDGDFNDVVFAYSFARVLSANNRVTDLIVDFHLVARGATYDHELGLHLPTLPRQARGTVRIERFDSGATQSAPIEVRDLRQIAVGGRRIDRIFASTAAALPRAVADKPFANTWHGHPAVPAASARIWIAFDQPVVDSVLGPPPFDPYIFALATDGTRADIHLPGFHSFDDRSPSLPRERGSRAFLDPNGAPFALLVPTSWRYPLEGTPIHVAYPEFTTWRDSRGRRARDWYEHPISDQTRIAAPIETIVPVRAWTLRGPGDRF